MQQEFDLTKYVPTFPDFPKEGVNFYDITALLAQPEIFALTTQKLTKLVSTYHPDRLFAMDSKGFLFAAPIALNLGIGLSLLRKVSKLPGDVVRQSYSLEYGTDEIECRREDFNPSERLVVLDDVLATGGTLQAGISLLQKIGGNVVGAVTALEIGDLKGREKINVDFASMLYFPH